MTTWKRTPEALMLNKVAALEYQDYLAALAASKIASEALLNASDEETRQAASQRAAAKMDAYNEARDTANAAAQRAIDAILPLLDEEERWIYEERVKSADSTNGEPWPLEAAERWMMLQDNDEYAVFTEEQWSHKRSHNDDYSGGMEVTLDMIYDQVGPPRQPDGRIIAKIRPIEIEDVPELRDRFEANPGQVLKAQRERLGMSVAELAEKAGITRAMVYRYESGEASLYNASAERVKRLAAAIDYPVKFLVP